jgi:hypothetical protein
VKGVKGEKGDKGDRGDKGERGDQGERGKGDFKELLEIKAQLVIQVVEMDVTAKEETKERGEKRR